MTSTFAQTSMETGSDRDSKHKITTGDSSDEHHGVKDLPRTLQIHIEFHIFT